MGHNAKFGVYTMFCNTILKVVHFELLQVSSVVRNVQLLYFLNEWGWAIFLSKIFLQHQVVWNYVFGFVSCFLCLTACTCTFAQFFWALLLHVSIFSQLPNPPSRMSWSIPKVGRVVQL